LTARLRESEAVRWFYSRDTRSTSREMVSLRKCP
jgi:hypothetical protein